MPVTKLPQPQSRKSKLSDGKPATSSLRSLFTFLALVTMAVLFLLALSGCTTCPPVTQDSRTIPTPPATYMTPPAGLHSLPSPPPSLKTTAPAEKK